MADHTVIRLPYDYVHKLCKLARSLFELVDAEIVHSSVNEQTHALARAIVYEAQKENQEHFLARAHILHAMTSECVRLILATLKNNSFCFKFAVAVQNFQYDQKCILPPQPKPLGTLYVQQLCTMAKLLSGQVHASLGSNIELANVVKSQAMELSNNICQLSCQFDANLLDIFTRMLAQKMLTEAGAKSPFLFRIAKLTMELQQQCANGASSHDTAPL